MIIDPFDTLPPPPGLPRDEARRCIAALDTLCDLLPKVALTSTQQRDLGGYQVPDGPLVVELVAQALADPAGLFPDIPVRPDVLRRRQEAADAALFVARYLSLLATRAMDVYRLEQSAALREALSVLGQIRADRRRPHPGPRDDQRALALALAEHLLGRHYSRGGAKRGTPRPPAKLVTGRRARRRGRRRHRPAGRPDSGPA